MCGKAYVAEKNSASSKSPQFWLRGKDSYQL